MIKITNFHGMSINDFDIKYKQCKSKRDAERWLALKMIAVDYTVPTVAMLLGHDERTIRTWVEAFNKNGSAGIAYEKPKGQKKEFQKPN